jgi:hypothetical protein
MKKITSNEVQVLAQRYPQFFEKLTNTLRSLETANHATAAELSVQDGLQQAAQAVLTEWAQAKAAVKPLPDARKALKKR